MPSHNTTIEISKEYLHFGAAHFTIFDAQTRENLHGHNFHVQLHATAAVGEDGLTFDYNHLKNALKALCDGLDEQLLMPANSPHLDIEQDERTLTVKGEKAKKEEVDETAYIHRGISQKNFKRVFRLSEYVYVDGASLEGGILAIALKFELPEEKRPRKIDIS